MADLTAIRDAVGDALEAAFTGANKIQVQRRPGAQVTTPCAVVEPDEVDFTKAMQRGTEKWDLLVRVLLGLVSNEAAQLARDAFFGGVHDIKDAIEAHVPLQDGTAAQDVIVTNARKFDAWTYQGTQYLGVEFAVEVYA
jgi:hypothetical protein